MTDATADRAAALLAELEVAAFAAGGSSAPDLVVRAVAVARLVDTEAARTTAATSSTTLAIVGLMLAAVGAAAVVPEPLARTFANGVAAYHRGDYAAAERMFSRVSARAPRSSDAWANLGAAAWARGDTALASIGWQRALRLDPLDAETRERLAVVQPGSFDAAGYVPPVPANIVAAAAMLFWMGGWFVLAWRGPRRAAGPRGVAAGSLLLGFLLILATLELERRTSVAGLGAVRVARPLLGAPSPGAAALASTTAGEVGRIGAREGAWVHIALDAERAGWVPVASLLRLDDPVD